MDIIIFNTATEEILQMAHTNRIDLSVEELADRIYVERQLVPADYTARRFSGYSTNQFKELCYILNGVPMRKSFFNLVISTQDITADGVDSSSITNVPEGTEVFINDVSAGIVDSDGLVEVTSSVPKTLVVKFTKEYYVTKEVIINAT